MADIKMYRIVILEHRLAVFIVNQFLIFGSDSFFLKGSVK